MPVQASDLIEYGSTLRPGNETDPAGGAIALAARPLDTQIPSGVESLEFVSSAADTRTLTITYRDVAGVIQTPTAYTLDGTTPVAGPTGVARILTMVLSAAGAQTVIVRVLTGGATRHTFNPDETNAFIMFRGSSSSGVQESFWEKTFWRNTSADTALTSAEITLTADPSAKFTIGLETVKDGSQEVANRKTTPGVTEQDNDVAIAVPTGSLNFGEAIGLWRRMTLAIDAAADTPSSTTQLAGQTV